MAPYLTPLYLYTPTLSHSQEENLERQVSRCRPHCPGKADQISEFVADGETPDPALFLGQSPEFSERRLMAEAPVPGKTVKTRKTPRNQQISRRWRLQLPDQVRASVITPPKTQPFRPFPMENFPCSSVRSAASPIHLRGKSAKNRQWRGNGAFGTGMPDHEP